MCVFFVQNFGEKNYKANETREKLLNLLFYKKCTRKMLTKLTPGVNFINILRTAFALVDPESVKNTVKSPVSFYAFGIYKRKSCM